MASQMSSEELLKYFLELGYMPPVGKTFDEVSQDMINFIFSKNPNIDTKAGSGVRDVVIDPFAYVLSRVWDYIYQTRRDQSILTATGTSLDRLVANYFLYRKQAVKATGTVDFIRYSPPTADISIPKGTVVATVQTFDGAKFYATTQIMTMLAANAASYYNSATGEYVLTIPIESMDAGSAGNTDAGTIVVLPSSIQGISTVRNSAAIAGGSDAESDDSLRRRVILQIWSNAMGTSGAYAARVLELDRVKDAKVVFAGHPLMTRDSGNGGKVDIYVRGTNNLTKSATFTKADDADFVFVDQPVLSIVSVSGSISGTIDPSAYTLIKDSSGLSGSTRATDALHWVSLSQYNGEAITVQYTVNDVIREAQAYLEDKRVVTADVLIKEAIAKTIDMTIEFAVISGYVSAVVQDNVKVKITEYIDKSLMGVDLTKAVILKIVQNVEGVGYVKTDTTIIQINGSPATDKIDIEDNQYMVVGTITPNILV